MKAYELQVTIADSERKVREAELFLSECALIANDIETKPAEMLMTVNGYSGIRDSGEIQTFVFPFYLDRETRSGIVGCYEQAYQAMKNINASGIPFTYHNGPYDLFWLTRYRLPVANYAYDSMVMFWSMFPELPKDLAFVSSIMLDDYVYWKGESKTHSQRTYLDYNGKDCERTLRNTLALVESLKHDKNARRNFFDAHRRVASFIAISLQGIKVDEGVRAALGEELRLTADKADARLKYLTADPEFNFRSPKQMKHLFYEILGAKKRNAKGRFVKTIGKSSVGKIPMQGIRQEHPVFRIIGNAVQDAITPAKQISNVINMRVAPWGRFYTNYNGVGTTTTRVASSSAAINVGSNAQNIRKAFRHWLVADSPNHVLFEVDFSAADDVFVGFQSGDANKIELFRSGKDAHSANVAMLFPNWTYEGVVEGKAAGDPRVVHPITGIRQCMKKVAHGCNYLMSAFTLLISVGRESVIAAAVELGHEDAHGWNQESLIDFCRVLESKYRNHYLRLIGPGNTNSWYDELTREVVMTGGYMTPFNYFQRFIGDPYDHGTLRAVAATVGQAGTAGRINMALDEFQHGHIMRDFRDAKNPHYGQAPMRISPTRNGCSVKLQTHDSFTFQVDLRHPRWQYGVEGIFKVMTRPVVVANSQTGGLEEFRLGIEADVGKAWGKPMLTLAENTLEGFEEQLKSLEA